MDDIRQECDDLVLRPGDLLVDPLTRSIGILMDMKVVPGDEGYMYASVYWNIYWMNGTHWDLVYQGPTMMEELGLKMSVVIGIYNLHSVGSVSGYSKKKKI